MLHARNTSDMNAEVLSENLQGRCILEDQGIDGRIKNKWTCKKWHCMDWNHQTQHSDHCQVCAHNI